MSWIINEDEFEIFSNLSKKLCTESKQNIFMNRNIIIVEDCPDMQKLMRTYLSSYSYNSIEFYATASQLLFDIENNRTNADFYIFDVNLPGGISGIDLVRYMREKENIFSPILLMSSDLKYRDLARKFFANDTYIRFLHKPQLRNDLAFIAQNMIDTKHNKSAQLKGILVIFPTIAVKYFK